MKNVADRRCDHLGREKLPGDVRRDRATRQNATRARSLAPAAALAEIIPREINRRFPGPIFHFPDERRYTERAFLIQFLWNNAAKRTLGDKSESAVRSYLYKEYAPGSASRTRIFTGAFDESRKLYLPLICSSR